MAKLTHIEDPSANLITIRDPMILVLLAAAGLSLGAGGEEEWLDAIELRAVVDDMAHKLYEAAREH